MKSESGLLSKLSTDSNKIMSKKLNKLLKEEKPDLIISTHPFSSQMCAYLKKKEKLHCKLATVMTDHAPHDQWLVFNEFVDFFFVSHDEMKIALSNKGIPLSKIYSTGIPISNRFLLNYNKDDILQKYNLLPDKKTILFFGGGEFGLGKTKTLNIFKILIENNYNLQIVAISGKNKEMKENFEKLVHEFNKEDIVRILEYTQEVPELMSISSLVITKPGGLTTTESLISNLPMIIINPIPGQEEQNAEFLENNNVAIWIKNENNAKEIFDNLFLNSNKLVEMKNSTNKIAKKESTKNICEILLNNFN
jgi:processive 1,2-diacylglycerol beta-glucosyltransferase